MNINAISFDLTNCQQRIDEPEKRLWVNKDGVAHLLQFNQGPIDWPFDLTQPDSACAFYGDQCASVGGAMLSMDVVTANKTEVLRGVFKYRSPEPKSLAMLFVGILWIPFRNFRYQINIEAIERGTTGVREAIVFAMDPSDYPNPEAIETEQSITPAEDPHPEQEPITVSSADDMFERMRSTPLRKLTSDHQQFDQLFPSHPLSLVRNRMSVVTETLKIDKMWWQSFGPFRMPR